MHPSLRIQHIDSLPEPTKSLALSASRGGVADVRKLQEIIRQELIASVPLDPIAPCIPAFYIHLNVDDLPSLREQQQAISTVTSIPDRLACTLLSMEAIADLETPDLDRQAREEVWLSVWPWVQFLEDEVNKKRGPELQPSSDEMRGIFLRMILAFCTDLVTASPLKSLPGVREFLTAGWAASLNVNDPPFVLGTVCTTVATLSQMSNPTHVEELVAGAGGTMSHLAALLVKHLRRIIPPPSSPDRDLVGIIIMATLSLARHSALCDDLVSHDIVNVLCGTVCALGRWARDTNVLRLLLSSLATCMDVLPHTTRMKEALDGGLLRAIVLCAGRPDATVLQGRLQVLLCSVLPQTRICHSVIGSLRLALDDAEPLTHNLAFRESKFFSMWQEFVRVATNRLAMFDRGEMGLTRACDNIECITPP